MTLTALITVNAVLATIVFYAVVLLHAHGVRHDRRHALAHQRSSLKALEPERSRDRIAA